MKNFVICYDHCYLRDTQAYFGPPHDDDAWEDDSNWRDYKGPIFLGIYEADNEEEAINKAYEKSNLCKEGFYVAYEIG